MIHFLGRDMGSFGWNKVHSTFFCQTPVLGLGLGVDFTFDGDNHKNHNHNNNNNDNNPHLTFF